MKNTFLVLALLVCIQEVNSQNLTDTTAVAPSEPGYCNQVNPFCSPCECAGTSFNRIVDMELDYKEEYIWYLTELIVARSRWADGLHDPHGCTVEWMCPM